MKLVFLRVDVKPLEKQLTRIANALDQMLIQEYNYFTGAPNDVSRGDETPSISYASDESTALRELREEYERSEGKPVDDDEEEEDNT